MPPRRPNKFKSLPVAIESEVESEFTLEEEISWCIQKLEKEFSSENITERSMTSLVVALRTLKSNKAPFIKKRQVMRLSCGDYRQEMLEDLRKSQTESKKMSIHPVTDAKSGSVVKISKSKANCSQNSEETSPNSAIVFNFAVPADEDVINLEDLKINPTENVSKET